MFTAKRGGFAAYFVYPFVFIYIIFSDGFMSNLAWSQR